MISVCLTTYNSEAYLSQQLESILAQLSDKDEVIISDDGSNDYTYQIVNHLQKHTNIPLRWIENKGEHGYTANFENAIRHAQGDYIFLSDHDDVWLPGKVEACLSALQDAMLVTHDATLVDAQLQPLGTYSQSRKAYIGFWKNLIKFGHLGCCMAFRKSVLRTALPFPTQRLLCTHDNWLYLVGGSLGKTAHLNNSFLLYRRHGKNVSAGGQGKTSFLFKLRYRAYLIYHLILRMARC